MNRNVNNSAPCLENGCPFCGSSQVDGPEYKSSCVGGCVEDRLWYICRGCWTVWRTGPDDVTPERKEAA